MSPAWGTIDIDFIMNSYIPAICGLLWSSPQIQAHPQKTARSPKLSDGQRSKAVIAVQQRVYELQGQINACGEKVGVIEVEIPDFLPMKPLKKKIDDLIKEEETKWVLFERAVEDLDLKEEDLLVLEEMREMVWKEEKKNLGL